ncbi:hypothetical protein V8E51_014799 [Hyaloscypha variabilis]
MPLQFSTLPSELRHQIYDHALDRSPRNIEVEVLAGKVVPKTPPPALLHLNRESRYFVLSIYKPWLPEFAGSPFQAPYAGLLAKLDRSEGQPVSCLDDVCFDLEQDMLLCQGRLSTRYTTAWPVQVFGCIEELYLRNMAVNIDGNLDNKYFVEALLKARNVETLCFLDMYSSRLERKVDLFGNVLRKLAMRDKARNIQPPYIAPQVMTAPTLHYLTKTKAEDPAHWYTCRKGSESPPQYSEFDPTHPVSCRVWTTYKYPKHIVRTATRQLKAPTVPKTNPRKRKAGKELDAALAVVESERADRTRIWIRPDVLAGMSDENRRRLGIAVRAASSTAGASSSSAPASEASNSDAGSEGSSSRPASDAGSVHEEDDNSEASDSESEDDAQEGTALQGRTPSQLHAHRFNFDIGAPEILVEWEDSPEMATWEWTPQADLQSSIPVIVATFTANNPALETGTPVRFHERNSGVVGFDFLVEFEGYPEELYWTWVPESNMQTKVPHMVDQWMIENASEVNADENVDEQILAEQNYAEHVRAEDNDDVKEEEEEQVEKTEEEKVEETEEADTQDTEMKDGEDREDDDANDEAAGDEETSEYVPKRFVAQRETPDGPEILVEWEDWPDEKDWTWEPLNNLQEDAPDMMKAWKASRKAKKVSKVFEVESILGKRKIKGEWHYLVKWKGFSKDEAKSLEPCEKLAVDVPELVEAFENHKPKRGRPKRVAVS